MSTADNETTPNKKDNRMKKTVFWVTIYLTAATCSVLLGKSLYQTKSIGRDGTEKYFQKPWFVVALMFLGMSMMSIYFETNVCIAKHKVKKNPEAASTILNDENQRPDKKVYFKVMIPACCDMTASFLLFVAMLWVDVSIMQILSGSVIIFSGLFRQFWLKKPLLKHQWYAILVIVFAVIVVGLSQFFAASQSTQVNSTTTFKMLGILLILCGQVVAAFQTVIEEKFLQDMNAPPNMVVGTEGAWGLTYTLFVMTPLAFILPGEEGSGIHEDFIDTFYLLKNSGTLQIMCFCYLIILVLINMSAIRITLYTSSVVRNLLTPIRTFLTWVISVFIHYCISVEYGEPLNKWSWLQLIGFIILSFGMLSFNGSFTCKKKEEETLIDNSV